MEIPIGPLTYQVAIVDGLRSSDDEKLYGYVNFTDQVICVEKKCLDKDRFAVVLLHEIIHAIVDDRMPGNDLDENAVVLLANGLADTLSRCPDLLALFGEKSETGTDN